MFMPWLVHISVANIKRNVPGRLLNKCLVNLADFFSQRVLKVIRI